MHSSRTFALAAAFFVALSIPAAADKGGGTSPGNSGDHKVVICHVRGGGNPPINITVDKDSQVQAHLRHGDSLGPCPTVQPPGDDGGGTTTTPLPSDTPTTPTETVTTPTVPMEVPQTAETPTVTETTPQEQLVAPERSAPKHKASPKTVARVQRQQKGLEQRVAQARAQEQLPHTGFPAGLMLALGAASLAGGLVLKRRLTT